MVRANAHTLISTFLFTSFIVSVAIQAGELSPFRSDGCSLFPDSDLISKSDWCSCCFEHDVIYWRGGTQEERERADIRLKECVLAKTNSNLLAETMYKGVRIGGSPYFYNWYRWGYGWTPNRRYEALTESEMKTADKLLLKYYQRQKAVACPVS